MLFAMIVLLIIVFAVLMFLSGRNLRAYGFALLLLMLFITIVFCIISPKMHKPVSFEFVDYLIKFEDSGKVTVTKQVTSTKYKKVREEN